MMLNSSMKKSFSDQRLQEIKLWAWAATVLPITGLSGIFFVWAFGTSTLFDRCMTIGGTAMFSLGVSWWWWAIYTIARVIKNQDHVITEVTEVSTEIRNVKSSIHTVFVKNK